MYYLSVVWVLFVFVLGYAVTSCSETPINAEGKLATGDWLGKFVLSDGAYIPFNFYVSDSIITISNSSEKITTTMNRVGDSIVCSFPVFGSDLKFKQSGGEKLSGYWHSYKKDRSSVCFVASTSSNPEQRFDHSVSAAKENFQGKWKVGFNQVLGPYGAIGLFEQFGNVVTGTFLTETGDYRYLQGNVISDTLFLSCFDGAHAFLFKAQKSGDSLSGVFYSGNHYLDSLWVAVRNDSFELRDPYALTFLKSGETSVSFALPDVFNDTMVYPSRQYNNRVVILQIFGSWCPNCKDESLFLSELYSRYHKDGLEVLGVAFESQGSIEERNKRLLSYANSLTIPYRLAVGGGATKAEASAFFPQLNEVSSFPTCLFIDKTGIIRKIHTGFYGPGTGSYYHEYVKNTTELVETLLAE
jgi:thiol-disulfide isomerase/thioredoxin